MQHVASLTKSITKTGAVHLRICLVNVRRRLQRLRTVAMQAHHPLKQFVVGHQDRFLQFQSLKSLLQFLRSALAQLELLLLPLSALLLRAPVHPNNQHIILVDIV